MSKPWSEMKITFSDVIARLEKLESSDDLYERKTRAATRVYQLKESIGDNQIEEQEDEDKKEKEYDKEVKSKRSKMNEKQKKKQESWNLILHLEKPMNNKNF